MVQMKTAMGDISVGRAMLTDFQLLSTRDPLDRAVELIFSGMQTDFPVVEGNALVGVLTRSALLAGISRQGQDVPVADIMHRDFQIVDANEMLKIAFARLQTCGCHTMPVTHHGQLVGLLTSDNIGEFLMIQSALGQACNPGRILARGA